MAGQWKTVAELQFCGSRFEDHALDVGALTELSCYQKLVADTAKALWRRANPDRERLPAHFEDRTRLYLREIKEGSAVAPLEAYVEEAEVDQLWEEEREVPPELLEAVSVSHAVFDAADNDRPLPEGLPRELIPEYVRFGEGLQAGEVIRVRVEGKRPARLSVESRDRLLTFVDQAHTDTVVIEAEVVEADVRQRKFQVVSGGRGTVTVPLPPEQELLVTSALKEHKSARVRITGPAELSASGEIQRFLEVKSMELKRSEGGEFDMSAPAIEDVLASIAAAVPEEEWSRLPKDLTSNLDHYIYGSDTE